MDKPSVNWILTLTRNCLPLTMRAVKTFLSQDIGNIRVLLIDNGSDNTPVWARRQPGVRVFTNRPPKSVAASWNYGLKYLFESEGAERALVCNNDVELRPETYSTLDSFSRTVHSPTTATPYEFITAVGDDNRERALGPRDNAGFLDSGGWNPEPRPDFSCYLIRRSVWDTVGPFDEGFKGAFFEDNDYHVRMHRAGVEAVRINLPYYHVGSATVKSAGVEEKARILEMSRANRNYFLGKWGFDAGGEDYEEFFKGKGGSGGD